MAGEIVGIDLGPDPLVAHDHGDVASLHPERGRDLAADEARTDHEEARSTVGQLADSAVVGERAVVDHTVRRAGEPPRLPAGREEQGAVLVDLAPVIGGALLRGVQLHDPAAEHERSSGLVGLAPDAVGRLALPQTLCQRRPVVGLVGLGTYHGDGALGILLPDAVGRGVGGHAATDDEVVVSGHVPSWRPSACLRAS